MKTLHERENYSWGIIQDMIEREISSAFRLREPIKIPSKKEIKQIIKNTVKKERISISGNFCLDN